MYLTEEPLPTQAGRGWKVWRRLRERRNEGGGRDGSREGKAMTEFMRGKGGEAILEIGGQGHQRKEGGAKKTSLNQMQKFLIRQKKKPSLKKSPYRVSEKIC